MAAVTDIRKNPPACPLPTCPAGEGDRFCYTATGFPRQWHTARRKRALGDTAPEPSAAGSLAHRRPSEAQHRLLAQAMAGGGVYELSGYRFHGDAQRRRAMQAMAGTERGWFRHVRETPHGTVYEITDDGRSAYYRYEDWMDGR